MKRPGLFGLFLAGALVANAQLAPIDLNKGTAIEPVKVYKAEPKISYGDLIKRLEIGPYADYIDYIDSTGTAKFKSKPPVHPLVMGPVTQEFKLDKKFQQGDVVPATIVCRLPIDEEGPAYATLFGKRWPIFHVKTDTSDAIKIANPHARQDLFKYHYTTMMAIPMKTVPGWYSVNIQYIKNDKEIHEPLPIEVTAAPFSSMQTINISLGISASVMAALGNDWVNFYLPAFSKPIAKITRPLSFISPTTGTITGMYGDKRSLNGTEEQHGGIDIAAPAGTRVYATEDGLVEAAGSTKGQGSSVVINHGALYSVCLHLDENLLIHEGDYVKKGQLIGYVGGINKNDKVKTGSNLDYRIFAVGRNASNNIYAYPINPADVVSALNVKRWTQVSLDTLVTRANTAKSDSTYANK